MKDKNLECKNTFWMYKLKKYFCVINYTKLRNSNDNVIVHLWKKFLGENFRGNVLIEIMLGKEKSEDFYTEIFF